MKSCLALLSAVSIAHKHNATCEMYISCNFGKFRKISLNIDITVFPTFLIVLTSSEQ
jgi:hypothetical protein